MSTYTPYEKALVLIPKATGALSLIGSAWIVYHILSSKKRRSLVYHRLLLMMSISDILGDIGFVVSTWSSPPDSGFYLASGTQATCTLHGTVAQTHSLTTPSYNAVLSLYYVLVVCLEYRESKIKGLEILLHAYCLVLGFGCAIAGIPLTLYNPAGFQCWIGGWPAGCDVDASVECQRGNHARIFRWVYLYAWVWMYFVLIAACIGSIYYKVLMQERKIDRYKLNACQERDRRRSRRVAFQAFLYVGAYYLTFLFGTVSRSFFNAIIYMMPRYQKWRDRHKDRSFINFVWNSSNQSKNSWFFGSKVKSRRSQMMSSLASDPVLSQLQRETATAEKEEDDEEEERRDNRDPSVGVEEASQSNPTDGIINKSDEGCPPADGDSMTPRTRETTTAREIEDAINSSECGTRDRRHGARQDSDDNCDDPLITPLLQLAAIIEI